MRPATAARAAPAAASSPAPARSAVPRRACATWRRPAPDSSASCPADVLAASGTLCRPAAGVCDVAETCTGTSPACPTDVLVAAGTTCRPPRARATSRRRAPARPPHARPTSNAANGTSCSDGNACNGVETCQAGTCTRGNVAGVQRRQPVHRRLVRRRHRLRLQNNTAPCSDGVACTNDLCSNGVCVSTSSCPVGQTCNSTTGACEVPAGGYTLWPTNPIPAIVDGGDPNAVQLGVKFRSDVAGFVTGVRFYKTATNTGTHVGNALVERRCGARHGDVQQRIDVRMAAAELLDAGRDRREHRLRRLLLRTQRSLQREPRLLRAGRSTRRRSMRWPTGRRAAMACSVTGRQRPSRRARSSRSTTGWTSCSAPRRRRRSPRSR